MLGITDDSNVKKSVNKSKRKRRGVTFNDEEIIINPEDIDPAVGRFRNLIQTTVVPSKRMKFDNPIGVPTSSSNSISNAADNLAKHMHPSSYIQHLYQDLPPSSDHDNKMLPGSGTMSQFGSDIDNMSSKFGLILPNPAPEVAPASEPNSMADISGVSATSSGGPYGASPTKSKYLYKNMCLFV